MTVECYAIKWDTEFSRWHRFGIIKAMKAPGRMNRNLKSATTKETEERQRRVKEREKWKENIGESVEQSEIKSSHQKVVTKVNCLRDIEEMETLNNVIEVRIQKIIGELQGNNCSWVGECECHTIFIYS